MVGVVGNIRSQALRGDIETRYFVAAEQAPPSISPTFFIRTAAPLAMLAAATRTAIQQVDAAL